MATPEPLVPSRRLRSAAAAERDRLGRDLARLDERAGTLQRELNQVDARRDELRDQLALLARLADSEDSPFPTARNPGKAGHLQAVTSAEPAPKGQLRGARIREVAVLLLASSPNPRRPIHYQQWYELLRAAGYGIDAREPAAAFLTQINRSPVVRRAGAPGVYALDFDAPAALRERLHRLEAQLATETAADGSADDLAASSDRRAALMSSVRTAERELEESLRAFAAPSS